MTNDPNKMSQENLMENGKVKAEIYLAVKSHLMASAFLEIMRPVHEKICNEAIKKFKPVVADREHNRVSGTRRRQMVGEPINDWNHLYRADEELFAQMSQYHKEEMAKAGYTVEKPTHCPFLVAEHMQRETVRVLIDTMEPYTGISSEKLWGDKRDKFLDLTLRLLVTLCENSGQTLSLETA